MGSLVYYALYELRPVSYIMHSCSCSYTLTTVLKPCILFYLDHVMSERIATSAYTLIAPTWINYCMSC